SDSSRSGDILYPTDSRLEFALGSRKDLDSDDRYRGEMREVRIWNAARSSTQIRDAMLAGPAPDEAGLLRYWKMDDGPGKEHQTPPSADPGLDGTRPPRPIPGAKGIRWFDAEPLVPAPVA